MISHTEGYADPSRMGKITTTITFFEKEIEVKDAAGKSSFRIVDFFTYQQPNLDYKIERFAYPADKVKYADIWQNYLRKKKGSSLSAVFDKKTEEYLRSKKVETLEQLAELSEKKVQQLGQSGKEWQDLAIQFLNEKEDPAPRRTASESKALKSILSVLTPAQKDLLPSELKKEMHELS